MVMFEVDDEVWVALVGGGVGSVSENGVITLAETCAGGWVCGFPPLEQAGLIYEGAQ